MLGIQKRSLIAKTTSLLANQRTAIHSSFAPQSPLHSSLSLKRSDRSSSTDAVKIASPKANVGGKTQAEMGDKWWQWVLGSDFPNGNADQVKSVYFLPGSFGGGNVAVPVGNHVFTPVLNSALDDPLVDDKGDPILTVAEERAALKSLLDAATGLHFNVTGRNGSLVQDWSPYRQVSPPGGFSYAGDSIPSTGAVSDGYWVLLNPLPPGTYTVNFGGTLNLTRADGTGVIDIDGDGNKNGQSAIEQQVQALFGTGSSTIDATYTITSVPRSASKSAFKAAKTRAKLSLMH